MSKYFVNPDITQAETLPSKFYRDAEVFEQMKDEIFLKSWHWLGDSPSLLPLDGYAHPFSLLDAYMREPMVLVRDKESKIRCMSNVCTHRGNLVVNNPGKINNLACMYHGRQWTYDGTFKRMPEFQEAKDFPRPCDHLHNFKVEEWGPFVFTGLEEFKLDLSKSKDYLVNCHWALYCDNYLEGFHIPFVHPDLNAILDYDTYSSELFEYGTLQLGYADGAEETYDLPTDHPSYGKDMAAFYFWIFPNIMLNFYPWGLSVNVIKPISMSRTKVSFITYIHDEAKYGETAGALMDKVEREDEFVVEGVYKGLQSRYYNTGRFSPTKEEGVHHFHRMLAERIK